MQNQLPHSALRAELRRRGLPPAYIERLVAEINDHFTDLVEERNSRMGAARKLQFKSDDEAGNNATNKQDELQQRLGEPTRLAVFAAEQYHSRSFFGRHPLLTFLVGPLPLLVASWLAVGILFFVTSLVMKSIDFVWAAAFGSSISTIPEENHPFVQAVALTLMTWVVTVVPPLVSGWFLCRVAARNGLPWKWPMVGCGLLAVVAAASWVSYRIKTIDAQGQWMVGFTVSSSAEWWLTTFLPKFALAMAIGLLLLKRSQDQRVLVP